MPFHVTDRPFYSRAERISDAAVHWAGLFAVTGAVPALIVMAMLMRGDTAAVAGTAVYGATLVLMILCSALYNSLGPPGLGWLWRRLDHSAIYLKIAGTYTPFAMITGQGTGLVIGLWGAAAAGVAMKLVSPQRFRWVGLALYLAMGWAGVVAGGDLLAAVPGAVTVLMVVGGLIYTAGVVFYLWDRLRFHNTIWHIFVLAASFVFYAAVVVQVVA
jgi:hemolysin III